MLYRINQSAVFSAQKLVRNGSAIAGFARRAVRSILTTAHNTLSLFGLSALIVIGLMLSKPELAQTIRQWLQLEQNNPTQLQISNAMDMPNPNFSTSSNTLAMTAALPTAAEFEKAEKAEKAAEVERLEKIAKAAPLIDHSTQRQQQWVTSWLSKRYRVAGDAANMLVATSYSTAKEIKLDPLLILAVMAIESGLNPFAESPMGAQGLMQVMSKVHHAKFQDLGGIKEALNPHANIRVGALILKDYVERGGSIEAGLKRYVGAAAFETDAGYGSRVMAEYNRLKEVANGKSISTQVNPVTGNKVRSEDAKPNPPAEDANTSKEVASLAIS